MRVNKQTKMAREKFLAAFRQVGTVLGGCTASGVGRQTVYDWLREDPGFKAAFETCDAEVTELLETSALKRALGGSDLMTIFLLKARDRAKYGDHFRGELTGKNGGPLIPPSAPVDMKQVSDALLAQQKAFLQRELGKK